MPYRSPWQPRNRDPPAHSKAICTICICRDRNAVVTSTASLGRCPQLKLLVRMSEDGLTLADMLATVPELLAECAPSWGGCSLKKALRLVNKELSVTTMRVVLRASVQLGEGACPSPQHVARIMQPARLDSMTVTVATTSGRPGPTLGQQLAALESQMAELVHGMGAAMKSVLFVTIWFRHNHIRSGRSSAKAITTSNDTQIPTAAGCPASFAVAARTVCTLLAEALPCLCQLSLQGCCRDPAFASFGASCPDLTYLQVEALSLPIKALKSITTHLPQLHSLSLTSPYLCPDGPQLMEYVEESLLALQPSTLINSFDLSFRMNTPLVCKPGCWLQLPPNLHAFHSSCEIRGILHATALLGAIRDLFLAQPLRLDELLQILSLAPQLQKLYLFTDPACLMQCGREDIMSGIALLRERLLTGLELCLSSIHLVESSGSLAAVLTAMPAHVNLARRCVLTFSFDPQPQCMAEVARVFRGLYELTLLSSTAVVGKNVLRPLVACTSLRKLHICLTISHTTTDLVQLCLDMPALKVLHFKKSAAAAVDLPELLSALAAQGRVMEIKDTLV